MRETPKNKLPERQTSLPQASKERRSSLPPNYPSLTNSMSLHKPEREIPVKNVPGRRGRLASVAGKYTRVYMSGSTWTSEDRIYGVPVKTVVLNGGGGVWQGGGVRSVAT